MVEFFIAGAQALSLAALIYGAYFVLVRGPQLARTPAQPGKSAARGVTQRTGERGRG